MRLDNEIKEFDQCRKKIISSTEIYLSKSQENSISFSRMGIDYYVLIWRKRRGEDWIRSQEFNKTSVDRYRKNIKYTKTSAGNRLEKKRIMDREQFIYSFLSNPGRRKNTVHLSTSRKWQSCQIQGMALDHFVFPKQPVVSADRCPTYVCPILPAAVSSRLMALPFSLNYDGNVHPLLSLPSPISRPSLSTRCTREPIRFTFLPSPPLSAHVQMNPPSRSI